jgi:hypothetical protein
MVEEIKFNNNLLAVIVRCGFSYDGAKFITENHITQQVAHLSYKSGHNIPSHYHHPWERTVMNTLEVLIIKRGKIRVDFYSSLGAYYFSRILSEKDTILFISGGHGFEILEDVDMLEIKQGPYIKDDRVFFKPVDNRNVIF